jgi:hypothetical protein
MITAITTTTRIGGIHLASRRAGATARGGGALEGTALIARE